MFKHLWIVVLCFVTALGHRDIRDVADRQGPESGGSTGESVDKYARRHTHPSKQAKMSLHVDPLAKQRMTTTSTGEAETEVMDSFAQISKEDARASTLSSSKAITATVELWMWDRSNNKWSMAMPDHHFTDLKKETILNAVQKEIKEHVQKYCPMTAQMYYPRPIRSALYHVLQWQEKDGPISTSEIRYPATEDCDFNKHGPTKTTSISSLSVDLVSQFLLESDTTAPKIRCCYEVQKVVCTKDRVVGRFIKSEQGPTPFESYALTFKLRKGQKLKGSFTKTGDSAKFSTMMAFTVNPMNIEIVDSQKLSPLKPLEIDSKVKLKVAETMGTNGTVPGLPAARGVELLEDASVVLPEGHVATVRKVERGGKSVYQLLCRIEMLGQL